MKYAVCDNGKILPERYKTSSEAAKAAQLLVDSGKSICAWVEEV